MSESSHILPVAGSRRAFLKHGSLVLAAAAAGSRSLAVEPTKGFRVGLVTDLHYADKPASGSRHYRDTPAKLAEAAEQFAQSGVQCVVELGDLIDAADSVERELGYLKRINRDFTSISDDCHYVLGNHCVYTLRKQEFLDEVKRPKSWYSFDRHGWHFVILDSCFRSDGQPYGRGNFEWTDPNVSAEQLEWLKSDLQAHQQPTVVFAHQRLDVSNHYGVRNAAAVRSILESANVQLVLQGHSHKNDVVEINGIHYATLVAMVEGAGLTNSGFSVMQLAADGTIEISGFRHQADYRW